MSKAEGLRRQGRSSDLQRKIDRFLGIPLVWILGTLRKLVETQRFCPQKIQSLAVLKASAIGDTIILSSVVFELTERLPQTHFTWMVGASNRMAAELVLQSLSVSDRQRWQLRVLPMTSPLRALVKLRSQKFDVWIDFGSWSRLEALYSLFSRSQFKVGFRSPGQARHWGYDETRLHDPQAHENTNDLKLLTALGFPMSDRTPRLLRPTLSKKKMLLMHLFAGGSKADAKQWPLSSWQELILQILKLNYKGEIVFTGGPADQADLLRFKNSMNSDRVRVVSDLTLAQTADLLLQAELLISVDTGILHLASALGVPTIGLYGPTHSLRWGPLHPESVALNVLSLSEAPLCYGFEKTSGELMAQISVSSVLERVRGKIELD